MDSIPHIVLPLNRDTTTIIDETDADLATFKWSRHSAGYAYRRRSRLIQDDGRQNILLHRTILQRMIGRDMVKGEEVDHINRNRLDNRRVNLRLSDRSLNASNRALQENNTSGYRGVYRSLNGKRWRVALQVRGENLHLGVYDTPEEAARVYDETALRLRGPFAVLNFQKERS